MSREQGAALKAAPTGAREAERVRNHDRAHRQVLLRPQRHLLAGGEGGFQQLSGPRGPHRERGIALRHHRAGLHPAQPAAGPLPPAAGRAGLPLQPVRLPGELHQRGDPQQPQVRAPRGWLRAQLHPLPEVPGERAGHPPCLRLPEGAPARAGRQRGAPHGRAALRGVEPRAAG